MALDQPAQITLLDAHWSGRAEELLGRIEGSGRHLADWQRMVESGAAKMFAVRAGEANGFLIWRIEHDGSEKILAVCAFYCEPVPGVDMSRVGMDLAQRVGRACEADYVRFWTQRPGLMRKAEAEGYDVSFVCERAVK